MNDPMLYDQLASTLVNEWPADYDGLKNKIISLTSVITFESAIASKEFEDLIAARKYSVDVHRRCVDKLIAAQEYEYCRWLCFTRFQIFYHRILLNCSGFLPPVGTAHSWFHYYLPISNSCHLVLVDFKDYELYHGYKVTLRREYGCLGGGPIHRIIFGRYNPNVAMRGLMIDHIDGNHFDCRRSNLRIATPAQNSQNRFRPKTNRSGYKGVSKSRFGKGYSVEICVNGKRESIGYWLDKDDAARAYNIAAKDRCGEFAKLNYVSMTPEDEKRIRFDMLNKQDKTKTTSFYGVSLRKNKKRNRFYTEFRFNGERYSLGAFETAEAAANAVDDELEKLGGERRNGTKSKG